MEAPPPLPNQGVWHYQLGARQLGPVPFENMLPMIQNGVIVSTTLVWREGMMQWAAAGTTPELAPLFAGGTKSAMGDVSSKKMAAGLLAIFLGTFGVHKFILGYTSAGVICIVISLVTCGIGAAVMHIIGIVEGVIYLSKSDQDFYNTYIANKKEWF